MSLPERQKKPSIEEICRIEGIPVTGITIMGGSPYINVTGLDKKLDNLCKNQGLVKKSIRYEEIQRATKENGMHAAGWGIVELFDQTGFLQALKELNGTGGAFSVKDIRDIYTHTYKMRGFASPETLKMASMQLQDNIEMMAERRATSRAKREATGTGLTSTDEMTGLAPAGKPSTAPPQRKSAVKTIKEIKADPKYSHTEDLTPEEPPTPTPPEEVVDEVTPEMVKDVFDDPEPVTDEEIAAKITSMCTDISGGHLAEIPNLIKQFSSFTPNEEEPDNIISTSKMETLLKRPKWLRTTYGNVKTHWEENYREPGMEG